MLEEMVARQPPSVPGAGHFDRLPVHRSESPTGYSSAGCSPAEPASASPVTDNSSSIPIRRGNQMRGSTALQGGRPSLGYMLGCCSPSPGVWLRCSVVLVVSAAKRGCHLYFARRVTFLSCADILVTCRRPLWHRRSSSVSHLALRTPRYATSSIRFPMSSE
jgi:hypothetical protein